MAELIARPRAGLGKKAKQVRKTGNIPAILYGYGISPQPVEVEKRAFEKAWKEAGESTLVSLQVGTNAAVQQVLIQEVVQDVLRGYPLHVDFYAVRMDKPIEARVPIKFVGEAEAVKALGGVLIKVLHELEIEALPKDLPHEIEVDISSLRTFEDKISVADIKLSQGVTMLAEQEAAVVLVEAPRSEEELAAMEQPAEVSLDTIEIAGKKEKAEEDSEGDQTSKEKEE